MNTLDKFNSQASDILTNNEMNKKEKKTFLAGLLQGYLAIAEEEYWEPVLDEAISFQKRIEEM